jgi:exodeoxyribonuclease VII large subunit
MAPDDRALTVSELNGILKQLVDEAFRQVTVAGEISNVRTYTSGHTYFSLKDDRSVIGCVLFADVSRRIDCAPADGMHVICRGRVDVYIPRGEYKLLVHAMEPLGTGTLRQAFDRLKRRLEQEGLFDPARKKPIPQFVQRVGVVTSRDGAALRDILSVLSRRFSGVDVLLYPVRVQGDGAAAEIADAIAYLNRCGEPLDVLLVGRGGGSVEDLWAFNEEPVARAIAASRIPVVSCVGHEIDYTIADYVADVRAPTPSAAAEMIVGTRGDLSERLRAALHRMERGIRRTIDEAQRRLASVRSSRVFRSPAVLFDEKLRHVADLERRCHAGFRQGFTAVRHRVGLAVQQLGALSPEAVLSRGYAVVRSAGVIVRDAALVHPGDRVDVRLSRGAFGAVVEKRMEDGHGH